MTPTIRQARASDAEAVAAFTRDTWADRDVTDYLPTVFDEWVDADGDDRRTLVADVRGDADARAEPGDVVGIVRGHRLSAWEAWASGMRVAPDHRGEGLSGVLTDAVFDWARDRGCTVCRNMTFSWNGPALGSARRVGFEPCTELRWAHPTPDPDAGAATARVDPDPAPDGAWAFWSASAAREQLRGLVMDDEVSWALSTLTRERLHAAAAAGRLVTVDEGAGGFAERIRTFEREEDGDGDVEYAEYAVGAWPEGDADAAGAVLAGVARDAAACGVDRTRVMIPEGVTWASDAATSRADIADEPVFVLAARL
ncbi:GNAT family N-acetyltransferase [Salinigranum salinum]|uniref:GNAT family N-acetyltransferase n=1 Tax=Salinigranum salinum TaxID=1364937 RepID=UPI001260CA81|nr:GNAT family N-acetyltransferase [Salinigranum salinum]